MINFIKLVRGIAAAGLVLIAFAACGTDHIGIDPGFPSKLMIDEVDFPGTMPGNEKAVWQVSFRTGDDDNRWVEHPNTISMDMGGGTTEDIPAGTIATSPFEYEFTMVNPSPTDEETYTYIVMITDRQGYTVTVTGTYTVQPALSTSGAISRAIMRAYRTALMSASQNILTAQEDEEDFR